MSTTLSVTHARYAGVMARQTYFPDELFDVQTYVKPRGRGSRLPALIPEGEVHGRLTATRMFSLRKRPDGRNRSFQMFHCECGNEVHAIPSTVLSGNTSSCGCLHTESVKLQMTTHGDTAGGRGKRYRTYRAELQRRRRARIYSSQLTKISNSDLEKILGEYEGRCWICDELPEPFSLQWDHVRPLVKGGTHTVDNLRPSCSACNSRKNDLWPFTKTTKSKIADEVRALRASLSHVSVA